MPLKTSFIRQWTGLLTQTTTDAPTAIELHNTFNDIPILERAAEGSYTIAFPNIIFDPERTIAQVTNNRGPNYATRAYWASENSIAIQTWTIAAGVPTDADEVLSATPVDIKLYNIEEPTIIPYIKPD